MCLICILIDKEKLTSTEANKAFTSGEFPVTDEHSEEVARKIVDKEIDEMDAHKKALVPGTKVRILIDTWLAEAGVTGEVTPRNLTEGLISVQYDSPFQGIFDFDPRDLDII